MMGFEAFLAAVFLVGLAELGDKTQLAALMLVSQYRRPARVLLGVLLAFLLVDGLAVFLGGALSSFLPMDKIRLAASAIFVTIGISLLLEKQSSVKSQSIAFGGPLLSAFAVTALAEMGDKTQVAAAVLSARYGSPLWVLAGLLAGVAIVNGLAIFAWNFLSNRIEKNVHMVKRLFGLIFVLAGILSSIT